jgi:hypothetical protein
MGTGKKLAVYVFGAIVIGAILLHFTSRPNPKMKPAVAPAPLVVQDSVPAPVPATQSEYAPTWVSVSKPKSTPSSASTFPSGNSSSDQSQPTQPEAPPADQNSTTDVASTPADQSSQPAGDQSVNATPSNNTELKEKLRRGH